MLVFVFLVGWIASAFFCASVASEKGYSGTSWGIAGFLFGFFALIAVAGLPDRKLRKYIRQIGEKQKAIEKVSESKESKGEEWVKQSSDWESNEKITIQFVMPSAANKLQLYNKLKSEIKNNKKIQGRFDESKIKSYEIANPLLGGQEFALMGEDLRTLFVMTGEKLNNIQTQWTGEF